MKQNVAIPSGGCKLVIGKKTYPGQRHKKQKAPVVTTGGYGLSFFAVLFCHNEPLLVLKRSGSETRVVEFELMWGSVGEFFHIGKLGHRSVLY